MLCVSLVVLYADKVDLVLECFTGKGWLKSICT